ncbi:MAG: D-alanyl-D-alanine carboxypeptidase [Clostridia bacterium]|nr:D-alanyl-D-alanine carboxypeptidase [Clostridia bacterium]
MKKIVYLALIALSFFMIPTKIFAIELSSPNAILIDVDSGKILYEKDAYSTVYPASTTKILTSIIALENCNLDEEATASYDAIMSVPYDGSTALIQVGEKWTIKQLVEAMMVCSANEAANIVAEYIGGSVESFASIMNTRAKEIGAKSSNFVNANGLHDDKHVTTVYDMAMIARHGMLTLPELKNATSLKNFSLPNTGFYNKGDRNFTNTNKLIIPTSSYYYQYATGMKTGYTSKALNCIVASAEKGGVELIAVVFGSIGAENRTNDVKTLFEYGFTQLKGEIFFSKGSIVKELNIFGGTSETSAMNAIVNENIIHSIPTDKNVSDYPPKIEINKGLKAPINSGDVVGTITYEIEGNTYEYNLIASSQVDSIMNAVATVALKTTKAIGKVIFWAILSVIGIIIALIFLRAAIITKKQRIRSRRRAIYNKRFR